LTRRSPLSNRAATEELTEGPFTLVIPSALEAAKHLHQAIYAAGMVRGIRGVGGRAGNGWASSGQCAGRSMLVIGGQAPACETLVTRNP
jgi:hypothetical protein